MKQVQIIFFQDICPLLATSSIKISFQGKRTVAPTVLMDGINSFNRSCSWKLDGVNLKMINCNTWYLILDVKNATEVIIENCTFGDWMFTQVLEVSIKDCSSKRQTSLIFQNTSGLIENITIQDSISSSQLRVQNYSYIQITNSKFVDNLVNTALIFVSESSTLEMSNCIIQNNQLVNSTQNHGSKNKGLVLLSNSSTLISENSTFVTNTGVVIMLFYDSKASIINWLFSGNINNNGAGLLFSKYSSLLINGTSFEKNSVGKSGGVISGINSTVTIGNSLLKNNTVRELFGCSISIVATEGGGVILLDFSQTIINNSLFRANTGPSIVFMNNTSLQIDSSRFVDNSACFGGAIARSYSIANISDTVFSHNNATMGAALYVDILSQVFFY